MSSNADFCYKRKSLSSLLWNLINLSYLPSATKLRRLCFYRRLSVHGGEGGVSASVHAGIPPPASQEQIPPRADTPQGADTPLEQTPPRAHSPPGADTPPRDTVTAADGTYPTGMHSCSIVGPAVHLLWRIEPEKLLGFLRQSLILCVHIPLNLSPARSTGIATGNWLIWTNSANSVTKHITLIKRVQTCSILCWRPERYHSTSKTQMRMESLN